MHESPNRRAQGTVGFRYEDIAQDGRVRLEALTASLGVIWRESLTRQPFVARCRAEGVLPILTRFRIEGAPGPFAIDHAANVDARFEIAHTVDGGGSVNRLLLVLETELRAPIGRTNLPPPEGAGRVDLVGRVRAEHVFTRPFGPADARKVLDASLVGGDVGTRVEWADPIALLSLPEGARFVEDELRADEPARTLGLAHTDSNQHVNSLVYPRLFEEAIVQRLARLDRSGRVLARSVDVRYRKPSFAGDRVAIVLRAYERAGRVGAVGAFIDEGGSAAKPRACLRMELE